MANAPYKYALDFLNSNQIAEAKKFLEFGNSIPNFFIFTNELERKNHGRIITDTAENKNKINDYFVINEEFELEYLADKSLITDFESFNGTSVYVGKFEPDYKKLLEWCRNESIPIFILFDATPDYL